jgi:hypothetical protein
VRLTLGYLGSNIKSPEKYNDLAEFLESAAEEIWKIKTVK